MKHHVLTKLCFVMLMSLSACADSGLKYGFSKDRSTQVTKAAILSAAARHCGIRRTDEYRAAFISGLQARNAINPAQANEIRWVFAKFDARAKELEADRASEFGSCPRARMANWQRDIDRGAQGDFTHLS